jgi:hypothetical protein
MASFWIIDEYDSGTLKIIAREVLSSVKVPGMDVLRFRSLRIEAF